jgi:hypothetical protein
VRLINQAQLSSEVMVRAQAEAARIFAELGVDLLWANATIGTPASPPRITVVVAPIAVRGAMRRALGTAIATESTAGHRAYAYVDRVRLFAKRTSLDLAKVLGHVIAHEMGHLLLGHNRHALSGIMRDQWKQPEINLLEARRLTFTDDHALAIRRNLDSRLSTRDCRLPHPQSLIPNP